MSAVPLDWVDGGERARDGVGEGRVVDVVRGADEPAVAPSSKVPAMASKRARSASGSWKGWPGASRAETPPSGMRKRTGPVISLTRRAIHSPMRAFSSAVVRIRVTWGLCSTKRRLRYRSGTVSRGPKFTMSRAPTEPTQGIRVRMNAPKRSSSAARIPPIIMSQISVVVRSTAAARRPLSASFSMDRPPTPVAWNTRQS